MGIVRTALAEAMNAIRREFGEMDGVIDFF